MLHEHENQVHAARLEIIVIWLIGETLYCLSAFSACIGCSEGVMHQCLFIWTLNHRESLRQMPIILVLPMLAG